MKKQVLFDVTALLHPKLSGVGMYVKNLANGISNHPDLDVHHVYKGTRYLRRKYLKNHFSHSASSFRHFSWRKSGKETIFHGPDFRLICKNNLKTVVTIHDLAFYEEGLLDPRFAARGREKLEAMLNKQRPDRIITVSGFIKERIEEKFPDYQGRVHVVYHGMGHIRSSYFERDKSAAPYILFVGNIERRKNVIGVIKAFEIVKREHPDLNLCLVGGRGFDGERVEQYAVKSKFADSIKMMGHVDDQELMNLYQHASAFVYPSFYEGFGIPIIEAYSCGCPVITSNMGAMKEVAGDAATLVDPYEIEDVAEKISQLVGDESLREHFKIVGMKRAQSFTWDQAVTDTVKVYNS